MMKIKSFGMYNDGGTNQIETDRGVFCFDKRLKSETKGSLYDGYPKSDNSNLIENSDELERELIEALKSYEKEFYQKSIDHLVKIKEVKGCQQVNDRMNEFLDKVDALCFEYGYEIHPTIHGWTGEVDENGKYKTIAIIGRDEVCEVTHIDGDGRGK